MFCPSCGFENLQIGEFCIKCGKGMGLTSREKPFSNSYFWALGSVPLVLAITDIALSSTFEASTFTLVSFLLAFSINTTLVIADWKQLQRAGYDVSVVLGILFVPAYLYRRAKITSMSQSGLIVWFAAFLLSLAVPVLGSSFVGSQVSTSSTETAIEEWLVENYFEDISTSVTCPSTVLSKPGANFICTADSSMGELMFQVTIENLEGDVTWRLVG